MTIAERPRRAFDMMSQKRLDASEIRQGRDGQDQVPEALDDTTPLRNGFSAQYSDSRGIHRDKTVERLIAVGVVVAAGLALAVLSWRRRRQRSSLSYS